MAPDESELAPERTWQEVAAELAREKDRDRIMVLSAELIRAYDAQKAKPRKPSPDNCIPWPRKQSQR